MATRPTKARRTVRRPKITLPKARRGRRLPPGVVRLDYPKVRGYIVRIGYIRTKTSWKPRHKAYFSDTRFGGKAKAKAAAEKWLQGLIRTGKPPVIEPTAVTRPTRRRTRARA